MSQDFDYLEETRRIRSDNSSMEWTRCVVSTTRPSYEDVKKKAEKEGKRLDRKQYEKACRDLGFK